MSVNSKWQRWVFASVANHLVTAANAASLPIVVEGLHVRSDSYKEASHKAEVVISGPSTRELSKGLYRVQVSVFAIISSIKSVSDPYTHLDKVGAIANALDQCIIVKEYDVGVVNPDDVGQLAPRSESGDEVRVIHIKPTVSENLINSVAEIDYFGYFSE